MNPRLAGGGDRSEVIVEVAFRDALPVLFDVVVVPPIFEVPDDLADNPDVRRLVPFVEDDPYGLADRKTGWRCFVIRVLQFLRLLVDVRELYRAPAGRGCSGFRLGGRFRGMDTDTGLGVPRPVAPAGTGVRLGAN
jgi:hypothetical protein